MPSARFGVGDAANGLGHRKALVHNAPHSELQSRKHINFPIRHMQTCEVCSELYCVRTGLHLCVTHISTLPISTSALSFDNYAAWLDTGGILPSSSAFSSAPGSATAIPASSAMISLIGPVNQVLAQTQLPRAKKATMPTATGV